MVYVDRYLKDVLSKVELITRNEYEKIQGILKLIKLAECETDINIIHEKKNQYLKIAKYNLVNERFDLFYLTLSNYYCYVGNYSFYEKDFSKSNILFYKATLYSIKYSDERDGNKNKILEPILGKYFYSFFSVAQFSKSAFCGSNFIKKNYDDLSKDEIIKKSLAIAGDSIFYTSLKDFIFHNKNYDLNAIITITETVGLDKLSKMQKVIYFNRKARLFEINNNYNEAANYHDLALNLQKNYFKDSNKDPEQNVGFVIDSFFYLGDLVFTLEDFSELNKKIKDLLNLFNKLSDKIYITIYINYLSTLIKLFLNKLLKAYTIKQEITYERLLVIIEELRDAINIYSDKFPNFKIFIFEIDIFQFQLQWLNFKEEANIEEDVDLILSIKKTSLELLNDKSWSDLNLISYNTDRYASYRDIFVISSYLMVRNNLKWKKMVDYCELLPLLNISSLNKNIFKYRKVRKIFFHLISYNITVINHYYEDSFQLMMPFIKKYLFFIKEIILKDYNYTNNKESLLNELCNSYKMDNIISEYLPMIKAGENKHCEFKTSLRWSYTNFNFENNKSESEKIIMKTIASFLNSDGGYLFIGVNNEGEFIGIEKDYKTFKTKPNKDGFLLHLENLVDNYFGKDIHNYLDISVENLFNKDICIIKIKASDRPIFFKSGEEELFFIRSIASSKPLNIKEASIYSSEHWNN